MNYPHDPHATLPKREGVAIAGLVLAIIGVLLSWVPALGLFFAFLGGIGAVLGLVGLGGTRKTMSGFAVGIGALSVAVAIFVTAAIGSAIDAATPSGTVSGGTASAVGTTSAPGQEPTTATWGSTYTWDDGVAITVQAPEKCASSRGADGRTIKVVTTIVNGSKKPLTTALLAFSDAQFDGVAINSRFEYEGDCKADNLNSTTVLPGNTFTFTTSYAVGDQPGVLQLVYRADLLGEQAVFVGQV